jgi:hypothetical protein
VQCRGAHCYNLSQKMRHSGANLRAHHWEPGILHNSCEPIHRQAARHPLDTQRLLLQCLDPGNCPNAPHGKGYPIQSSQLVCQLFSELSHCSAARWMATTQPWLYVGTLPMPVHLQSTAGTCGAISSLRHWCQHQQSQGRVYNPQAQPPARHG